MAWLWRWVGDEWSALIVSQHWLCVHCRAGQDRGRSLVCGILVGPCGGNLHGVGDRVCVWAAVMVMMMMGDG